MRTACIDAIQTRALGAVLCVFAVGCGNDDRPPNYQLGSRARTEPSMEVCDVPSAGCPCDSPGTLVDCGEIHGRVDEYVTCTEGVRLCGDEGTWGTCAGQLVTKHVSPRRGELTLSLGAPASCSESNPCDPLCRQIADTGAGLEQLGEGLCSTASGIEICPLCGYAGPVAELPYRVIPSDWQRVPATCSTVDDHCPLDMQCVGSTCRARVAPCAAQRPDCGVDLTLGKPCFDPADPNATYHVPLCNRGSSPIEGGTIRIGVDTRSDTIASCAPLSDQPELGLDYPNSGRIEIALSNARRIAPGECIDVNAVNSQSIGLELTGNRAWTVNYDAALAECNACNNGSLTIAADEDAVTSSCTACVNLACQQLDPATTLRGVVYDPGGRHPLPNVQVYVPNGTPAPFIDAVACDTCDSTMSGSPLVWTTTDATGHFSLPNVPSGVTFPVVVQLGRWRRQASIPAIDAGQTRWINYCSRNRGACVLTADATEPSPWVETFRRLRLPATQRRCNAWGCTGEGDLPAIAAVMGDADPLECTLRRIGIADSEFGAPGGDRRVHLYTASGMKNTAAGLGYGSAGLLAGGTGSLHAYSILLSGCDAARDSIDGEPYRESIYASGPSYNGWPSPHMLLQERDAVRDFVNAGGRLVTTHFQSMDLVYLSFNPPTHARFGDSENVTALVSPFEPATDAAFDAAINEYAQNVAPNFDWLGQSASDYAADAPAVYLFGNNVSASGNALHAANDQPSTRLPGIAYDIDTQSPVGQMFADWAEANAATSRSGSGQIKWQDFAAMVSEIHPQMGAVALLRGDSRQATRFEPADQQGTRPTPLEASPCLGYGASPYDCALGKTWGDSQVGLFQFDAPIGADQKCGRVAVAAGHASQHTCFSPSGVRESTFCANAPPYSDANPPPDCACFNFPSSANAACGTADSPMTPEELAFEYAFFSASQCIGELRAPPRAATLASGVFVRNFEANCQLFEQAVWQLFSWQAAVPEGAEIHFYGATADTESALDAAPFALIGVADQTTNTWTASNHTVDTVFRNELEPPDVSRRWLRVKAVFVPNGTTSPTLSEWRAVFNCVPNE